MEWPDIWFGILGTIEVRLAGEAVPVRAPRHRALLAALLCKPNQVLGIDEVAEAVWDGDPPPAAAGTLRSYVMRLRRVLGRAGERIETFPPGYRINLEAGLELDSTIFADLCGTGSAAARVGDWARVSADLSAGLYLWRGTPLQDVPSEVLRRDTLPGLAELNVQATELRLEAQLKHGRPAEAIPGLRQFIIEHPLRERSHALLMTALAACDRRAEALRVFRDLRSMLDTELGVEPSGELQSLHREILGSSDRAAAPQSGGKPAASRADVPTPRMLPAAINDFIGREAHVGRLLTALSGGAAGESPAVVIASITGMGGIGKTTFALHVAHRARDQYPDGQLFADLRGTAPVPAEPGAVLAMFLRQLGVDPASLPAETEERSSLYRSLLAERHLLIVLDDARDAAQLTPLIPGTAGCSVLVTMRNRVVGLPGAIQLDLDALSRPVSRALLGSIAGTDRVAAEPAAAGEILTACADLPLAVRLVAARLVSRPGWRIQDLADRLSAARYQLDELSHGPQGVRASFEVSYAGLSLREGAPASSARAFCLLGLWTGQDIGLPAAASLLGVELREAERILQYLVDMCLVQSPRPDRYSMHELIRAFAAERAERKLDASTRTMAITRLITWYTVAASEADALLAPRRRRVVAEPVASVAPAARLRSPADAIEWCENEHSNLIGASYLSQISGLRQLGWQLPTALWSFFRLQRYQPSLLLTQELALSSACAAKDQVAEALVHNNLAVALLEAGRFREAIEHLSASLTIRTSLDDQAGAATALNNLGIAAMQAGLPDQAVSYLLRSLTYREAAGDLVRQADIHANLGNIYLLLGRLPESVTECEAAERLFNESAHGGEALAETLDTLSQAHHRAGDLELARHRAEQVVAIRREICDQHGLAESLRRLGAIHRDGGDPDGARRVWRDAIYVLGTLGDPDVAEVETQIDALD
ncbi:MAG TPA: BTAD domain-containing putative transcriptional regulator [Trebonia sp.]|jgi:DNA-binding SARP family transcriptional activator/tetratricopeptide (TPR) repeat protein|nr:BTAD domain-containing putative transcriptional regulator [Trebonia sp.]